jgi:hypothetical protein
LYFRFGSYSQVSKPPIDLTQQFDQAKTNSNNSDGGIFLAPDRIQPVKGIVVQKKARIKQLPPPSQKRGEPKVCFHAIQFISFLF